MRHLVASLRRIGKRGVVQCLILMCILLTQLALVAKYSISRYQSTPTSSSFAIKHPAASSSDTEAAAAAQFLIRLSSSSVAGTNDSGVPDDSLLNVQSDAGRDSVYERASREGMEYDESEYQAHLEASKNLTAKTERPVAIVYRNGIVYRMNADGEVVIYDEVDRRSAVEKQSNDAIAAFGDTELLKKRLFSNYKGEEEDQNFIAESQA